MTNKSLFLNFYICVFMYLYCINLSVHNFCVKQLMHHQRKNARAFFFPTNPIFQTKNEIRMTKVIIVVFLTVELRNVHTPGSFNIIKLLIGFDCASAQSGVWSIPPTNNNNKENSIAFFNAFIVLVLLSPIFLRESCRQANLAASF